MANEAQIKTGTQLATPSTPTVATTGGAQPYFKSALAGVVQQVKASAGLLYGIKAVNNNAAVAYLQIFFQPAAGVTLGTTPPDMVIPLAASENLTDNFVAEGVGKAAGTGISIACTTTSTGAVAGSAEVSALFN